MTPIISWQCHIEIHSVQPTHWAWRGGTALSTAPVIHTGARAAFWKLGLIVTARHVKEVYHLRLLLEIKIRVSKYSITFLPCISLSYHGRSGKKIFQANHPKSWTTYIQTGRRCFRVSRHENTSETQWDSIVFPLEWLTLITLTRASIGED